MAGYLRKSVKVFREADSICINHALWTVTLPGEWVDGQPDLWPVLEGRMPKQSLSEESEELRDVLRLLELQQCFYAVEDKESYSFKELLRLFEPVCSEWYAEYYSHPLWRRLREGALSPNGFIAWVIHNYHVSRAAGMTDARCAMRAPRADVRRAFLA